MKVINVTTGADFSRTCGQQFSWPHTPLVACLQQVWSWENVKRHHVGQVSLGGEEGLVGFTGCHSARLRQTVQCCTSGVFYFLCYPEVKRTLVLLIWGFGPHYHWLVCKTVCVWCFPPFSLHWEYWESHCETSKQLMSLWGEGERLQWRWRRWTPDKSGRINPDVKLTLNLPDRQEGGTCDTSVGTEALCVFETG